jgi:hypothetical protein
MSDAPSRAEASTMLAKQPWPRISRELALYASRLDPHASAERALRISRLAVTRACDPTGPPWNFRCTTLWSLLTGAVDDLLGDASAESGAREFARIPMLSSEELDAELATHGLDPAELAREGGRIREDLGRRVPRSGAKRDATPRPQVPGRGRRRPELPTLSGSGWVSLVAVVLLIALGVAVTVSLARR